VARGTEEQLGGLHGLIAEELLAALQEPEPAAPYDDEDPDARKAWEGEMRAWRQRRSDARKDALRFLKDNGITASKEANPALQNVADKLPNRDDLERLMEMTP